MSYETLPDGLPVPQDDGACDHLMGLKLPDVALMSTQGQMVNLSTLDGKVVVYCYPMTGQEGVPLPEGWDDIPGARGCTPQNCAFRDHHRELAELGACVFGLSTQDTDYQQEMAERLHLPFGVLSDNKHKFCEALSLPRMEVAGLDLVKRVTIIAEDGVITHVHYPVFPTYDDAAWVIEKLQQH